MKHLSRQERIGALALGAVCLVAVGGAWLHRTIRDKAPAGQAQVTVIQEPEKTDTASRMERKRRRVKKASASGKRRKSDAKPSEKESSRDFLADTIPTVSHSRSPQLSGKDDD